MKSIAVDSPAGVFCLELVSEVAELVPVFYPRARVPADGEDGWLATFTTRSVEGRYELTVDGTELGSHPNALLVLHQLEYQLELRLTSSCRDCVAFHAGAVDVGGTACLLAGDPESGKTSSSFQLVELGHAFLAEEVAVVDPATAAVHPFSRSLALSMGVIDDFRRAGSPAHGFVNEIQPGYLRYLPQRVGVAPVPVDSLVLPRYRSGAASSLEELTPGSALTEVLGYCFEPRGEPEELIDRVIGLLERWRIVRMTYGSAAEGRRLLRQLFASDRSSRSAG